MSTNIDTMKKYTKSKNKRNYQQWFNTGKYIILGREVNEGLLFKIFCYTIFIATSYIYMNPILKMIVNMIMSEKDLIDPTVTWIPSKIYFGHIVNAWKSLNYGQAFSVSLLVSLSSAIFHCLSCGLAGYALARLDFPFKKVVVGLLITAFIIPPQVIILPTIIAYTNLGLNNSILSLIVPSVLGFGVKGALFVIIFRQFFLTQPKELEEAARIDGASAIKFYVRVMLPLARPAILVVFLFSFVWTWNDTYYPKMFLVDTPLLPLASEMLRLDNSINNLIESQLMSSYEAGAVKMAASFLSLLPPLLIFLIFQRHFVEGVERTGLVE